MTKYLVFFCGGLGYARVQYIDPTCSMGGGGLLLFLLAPIVWEVLFWGTCFAYYPTPRLDGHLFKVVIPLGLSEVHSLVWVSCNVSFSFRRDVAEIPHTSSTGGLSTSSFYTPVVWSAMIKHQDLINEQLRRKLHIFISCINFKFLINQQKWSQKLIHITWSNPTKEPRWLVILTIEK